MASAPLLPVADARALIVGDLQALDTETVKLADARGRVLRVPAIAQVSHPPADVSAMDGYAVRAADLPVAHSTVTVVGESSAGHPWKGSVAPGQAVRIFTGAYVPDGADAIVLQEDTTVDGTKITVTEAAQIRRHIRPSGQDFRTGDQVLAPPRRLTSRDIGLLAAMNLPHITVSRKPRIGVLSTGDEIVLPGDHVGEGQIVSANGPGLCAFIAAHGGDPIHLGIVKDDSAALMQAAQKVDGLDMLVTSGGVSVGDHDLVKGALTTAGFKATFHKIAMRPGKPLLYGRLNGVPLMGLPGNPVSSMVCAVLFLGPAIDKLQGLRGDAPTTLPARLGVDIKANDNRADHIRATLDRDTQGMLTTAPVGVQDSAMIANLARADALIVRAPFAPAAKAGEMVQVIPLD
jgi:molybdopterin molybdotransferase